MDDRISRTYSESIDQLLMTTAKHSKWWPNVNKDGYWLLCRFLL